MTCCARKNSRLFFCTLVGEGPN
ncbi:unnamed protein product [Ectocarpus sp. CCAP 1310/34]|nr:unnamed protein product [Ectocarpus sp. CCAP 1310/34]